MPAYLIFIREQPLHTPSEMDVYRSKLQVNPPESSTLLPRILYGAIEPLEGQAPDGVVIFEFPTVDQARLWYESSEYQDALPHRRKAGEFRVIIVDGISPEAFFAKARGEQQVE